jgi:hypothetical protein
MLRVMIGITATPTSSGKLSPPKLRIVLRVMDWRRPSD